MAEPANILFPHEAEVHVESLRPFGIEEIGTPAWMRQHELLEKLNMQAHVNAKKGGDEFVMEAFCSFDKFAVLVHELVAIDRWQQRVFPLMWERVHADANVRAYTVLYHEATLCGLLECMLFHREACDAASESLLELVDCCHRKLTWLMGQPKSKMKKAKSVKELIAESEAVTLANQAKEIQFTCAITSLTILRYMTDNLGQVHVSVANRMITRHDFVGLLCPLLDAAPWYKKERIQLPTPERGERPKPRVKHSKFSDNKWAEVDADDLPKLCKPEAQVWLAVYNLVMDNSASVKYEWDERKKDNVERLRKYFNDVLIDQLPILSDLRRVVEEMAMMDPGNMQAPASKPFIIEEAATFEELTKGKDWQLIADDHARGLFGKMTASEKQAEMARMAELYGNFEHLIGEFEDEEDDDATLLERHGPAELGRMYTAGEGGVAQDLPKAGTFLLLAAEQGDVTSMFTYGQRCKKGQGVPKDGAKATAWWEKAAAKGHLNAMRWLVHVYEKGDGVEQDAVAALGIIEMGVEQGDAWCQTKLGLRLLKGGGAAQAKRLLGLAAEQGNKEAVAALASLSGAVIQEL